MWYWLDELSDYPCKWCSAFDPRLTAAEQENVFLEGWRRHICCQNPFHGRKLHTVYGSLAELRSCKKFERCHRNWGLHGPTCNMQMERHLALAKSASPDSGPYAERLCVADVLSHILKDHLKDNGSDPRVTTRETLSEMNVPLECNRSISKKGGLQPSMLYSNEQLELTKKQRSTDGQPPVTPDEVGDLTRRFSRNFRTLDESAQKKYTDAASKKRQEKLDDDN